MPSGKLEGTVDEVEAAAPVADAPEVTVGLLESAPEAAEEVELLRLD